MQSGLSAIAVLALAAGLALIAPAVGARSKTARAEFQRHYPCPATGKPRAACPGFVVDHVVPLCAGGADALNNMQWQTAADATVKDRAERAQCRR